MTDLADRPTEDPADRPADRPAHRAADRPGDLAELVPAPRHPAGAGAVQLAVERRDEGTGVLHRHLVVSDPSDSSATRQHRQALVSVHDQLLRDHPDWPATTVVAGALDVPNESARWLYQTPALREWRRDLVPSAKALYPLQHPEATRLPGGSEIDEVTRDFFLNGLDGIGIRSRGAVLADVVRRVRAEQEALAGERARPSDRWTWVSLACGAAVPVLMSLAQLRERSAVRLVLVDVDADALDFARSLAEASARRPAPQLDLRRRDLVRSLVAGDGLVDEIGAGTADVVDALGIFEYFSDAACVRLLRNAHRLLAPGGVLVVGNMLADRPQLAFNQRAIGWPLVRPRSIDQLTDLVRRAGLRLDRTTVSVPADGVYAVVDVRA